MKKQFKTESKRLMDLMINSIYTNQEIFLRELISNASDAIDKLHYLSLTNHDIKVNKKKFAINLSIDESKRTITISDNGIGMDEMELETSLGTIAKSGTLAFKSEMDDKNKFDIIGQFGVGFYSAFMVASKIDVLSKKYGSDKSYIWSSSGVDGYTINSASKDDYGTTITLTIKSDTEDNKYSEYLKPELIKTLIRKYSNYITIPIILDNETLNDMVPIWKRNKSKITEEEYSTFYKDKFFDYEEPIKTIHTSAEGLVSYNSLLFIPAKAPYDFYTKNFSKGLQLYSNGVLIMEKCADLLPDYYSFVRGIVDTPDLSLNISREILQQDKSLKTIAKSLETKINKELIDLQKNDMDKYTKFFEAFGPQIKFGIYDNFGVNKDKLQDLLIFNESDSDKKVSLNDYVEKNKDLDKIYYVCGESISKIEDLPIVENYKDKNINILYCTDYMDEFIFKTLISYKDKKFVNILTDEADISSDEEKKEIQELNENKKDLLAKMSSFIDNVDEVVLTNQLKNHPVCLTSKGDVSIEMEKVINSLPNDNQVKSKKVLEINANHPISKKIDELYNQDPEKLESITKILYAQASLIQGIPLENPNEIAELICNEIS